MNWMAPDRAAALAGGAPEDAPAKRAINLLHLALGEGVGEPLVGLVGLGDEDESAGVLVEPMDNAEPFLAAASRQLRAAMMDERVDQRARPVPHRRMHHQPRLLVDGQQRVIFVDDVERDRLAAGLRRVGHSGPGLNSSSASPVTQAIARLEPCPAWGRQMHEALLQQRLGVVARALQSRRQDDIEAFCPLKRAQRSSSLIEGNDVVLAVRDFMVSTIAI